MCAWLNEFSSKSQVHHEGMIIISIRCAVNFCDELSWLPGEVVSWKCELKFRDEVLWRSWLQDEVMKWSCAMKLRYDVHAINFYNEAV